MGAGDARQELERQREAKERERRDDELGIPKFAALREWVDKLEAWCRQEAEEGERLKKENDSLNEMLDGMRDASESLEALEERLEDVRLGVRTLDEVLDERRRAWA